jgi:hypothetical protein
MVGLWDPEGDLTKPRQRLEAVGAGHVIVTFADCVAALEALAAAPAKSLPGQSVPAEGETARRGAVLQA